MITHDQLEIYRSFGGNDEKWGWAGHPGKEKITARQWDEIMTLLQELTPVKKGLASDDYEARIRNKLKEVAADEAVARELYDLA